LYIVLRKDSKKPPRRILIMLREREREKNC